MDGWHGKILRIDLSQGTCLVEEIDRQILSQFLGGRGLGAYLLYSEVPPQVDPLGPDNLLAFCTGPMTGVQVPTGGRYSLSTLSPPTGTVMDSNSGSQFGVRLKWAGFAALLIRRVAEGPVWLEVNEQGGALHPADDLWGLEIPQTIAKLREKGTSAVCIGPAGGNRGALSGGMHDAGEAYG